MTGLDPDLAALQEVRDCVERAALAQKEAARYDQARIDAVCEAVAKAAAAAAYDLGRLAVEETGIGRVHYKVLKNLFGSEGTWKSIKDEKTVGVLSRDERSGVIEVGTPAGVVAGIIPTTNPTSTAMNNALISLKGRNAIVLSPHPRAKRCIGETVEVMRRALERVGAPADLVQSLSNPTIESTGALMKHKKVAILIATGGSGLVRAAYSSGKPAYGVGPGNVPVYIDRTADLEDAARWIVASQSFDNATLCCSEQALVLDRPIAERVLELLQKRGAYLCNEDETRKLEGRLNVDGHMCPDVVGQDPWKVAELAGVQVPRATTLLLAHQAGVGRAHKLSIEILCPLLSIHEVDGWEEGCETSLAILHHGGLGHTIGLWAKDERVLDAWFLEKPASRIVVNGPTSMGAVGYSTNLMPAFSLGCGPQAGNITSDNITARHLINVKRAAFRRADWEQDFAANHARAAAFTGEVAPRGTGLVGDPGLRGARPQPGAEVPGGSTPDLLSPAAPGASADPRSSWRGNPPSVQRPATAASAKASGMPLPGKPAPRFTAARSAGATRPVSPPASPRMAATPKAPAHPSPAAGAAPASGPYVGMSLTPDEIQGILSHAGAGCPMGPCQGCPHNDVRTGACTA